MQDGPDHITALLAGQDLGQEVSPVKQGRDMSRQTFFHCDSFPHEEIANTARLLLQTRFRPGGVVDDRHVVTVNIGGSVHRDTHHAQLVPDAAQGFDALLHGNKLHANDSAFNSGLFLGVLAYQGLIQEDQTASAGTTIRLVPGVVRVNKHS